MEVDGQPTTQAFLGWQRVVRQDVAERQRLNQVTVLHRGQRRIMHNTSVRARVAVGGPLRAGG